ncbi:UNVERIFIED_CONTAM: hypothetical protein H355_010153, partial [Colinus virginianus]
MNKSSKINPTESCTGKYLVAQQGNFFSQTLSLLHSFMRKKRKQEREASSSAGYCSCPPHVAAHQDTYFLHLSTVSSLKNVDPAKFPMHYCYCLNNMTNDLTDFTALLVDIIGNSTSYLTEIFKSTSILSVRQSNDSDCIYICVMTGQTDLDSVFSSFMKSQEDSNKTMGPSAEHSWTLRTCNSWWYPLSSASPDTSTPLTLKGEDNPNTRPPPETKMVSMKASGFPPLLMDNSRPPGTSGASPVAERASVTSPALQPSPGEFSMEDQHSLCSISSGVCPEVHPKTHLRADVHMFWVQTMPPQDANNQIQTEQGCPQAILKDPYVTSPPVTIIVQKINPCLMELCRFFQLCLCVGQRRQSIKEAMGYCVEYYSWFLKNASYVCEKVKRIAYSH